MRISLGLSFSFGGLQTYTGRINYLDYSVIVNLSTNTIRMLLPYGILIQSTMAEFNEFEKKNTGHHLVEFVESKIRADERVYNQLNNHV